MQALRKVPVHRSLTRHQLVMGCDRDLFFMLTLCCLMLVMSGFTNLAWRNLILAVVLWFGGIAILARLANFDPDFKGILTRSTRYKQMYLPSVGKQGGLPPMNHPRWD